MYKFYPGFSAGSPHSLIEPLHGTFFSERKE
uniref:Uncharacterized protein n=1 Tax=Caudovirales sp. ctaix4 TaxID=2827635 RepID=A0A8S5S6D8_9CAUD|nr:MAG TPA: hypothetical protein [Caudovirales sp. ctaix4]